MADWVDALEDGAVEEECELHGADLISVCFRDPRNGEALRA